MILRLAYFDIPRMYPGGALHQVVDGAECTRLEFDSGAIVVQKEGQPARYYAVAPKDWWEPMTSGPSRVPDQTAAPAAPVEAPAATATIQPTTAQQKQKRR
jgi:hypothetical protein